MTNRPNPRQHRCGSPPPPDHKPRPGYIPNVVDSWNAGPGVVAAALYPYRHLPASPDQVSVREELAALRLRESR